MGKSKLEHYLRIVYNNLLHFLGGLMTRKELKKRLEYDPKTGVFSWISRNARQPNKPNRIAGTPDTEGYIRIKIDKKPYRAHRLAWLYMTGEWPVAVDHIDQDGHNNRWKNLQLTTRAANGRNAKLSKANTSGFTGVHRFGDSWAAKINFNRKQINLGIFPTKEEAIEARKTANLNYGYNENHGKTKQPEHTDANLDT